MLQQRAKDLQTKVQSLRGLRVSADQADRLWTRAKSLQDKLSELNSLVGQVDILANNNVSVDLSALSPRCRDLRRCVEDLLPDFESDPSQIAAPNERLRFEFLDRLPELNRELESVLLCSWQTYLDDKKPIIPPGLLESLASVPDLQPLITRVNAEISHLGRYRQQLPASAKAIQEACAILQSLNQDWVSLNQSVPEEVRIFLKQANSEGVPLSGLTKPVMAWLQQHNLDVRLRVFIR